MKIATMTPGEKFAQIRARHGYSQASLAELISVTGQTISNFESGATGKMMPRPWLAAAIVFGMTVAELNAIVFGDAMAEGTFTFDDARMMRWERFIAAEDQQLLGRAQTREEVADLLERIARGLRSDSSDTNNPLPIGTPAPSIPRKVAANLTPRGSGTRRPAPDPNKLHKR